MVVETTVLGLAFGLASAAIVVALVPIITARSDLHTFKQQGIPV